MLFLKKHQGLVLLLLYSVLVFAVCAFLRDGLLWSFDQKISSATYSYTEREFSIFSGVSDVVSPQVLVITSIILALILTIFKKNKWAIFLLITMGIGMLSVILLKDMFAIARPDLGLIRESGWGFPSGHTAAVAVFFFSILFALEETVSDYRLVFLWGFISFVFVFAIGFSRVYLGVHWFSDVVAGFALGVFWVSLVALIYEKIYELQPTHS